MKSLEERFWPKVDVQSPDACWPWKAGKTSKGYGGISEPGRVLRAHRVSWVLAYGEIPEGMCICHHCDNPGCVNPDHLFLGTVAENNADAVRKGRRAIGSMNSQAKLVERQVLEIRSRYAAGGVTQRALAAEFGVCHSVIGNIIHRRRWKHV